MIIPPICAALLIPETVKPKARLMPIINNNDFLSNQKRCWGKGGNKETVVSAAPKPITAPDAPALICGSNLGSKCCNNS